jgi:hypothetical protein
MTSPTKHPDSISAALDRSAASAHVWRADFAYPRWDEIPTSSPAPVAETAPESYLSKQALAAHYAMSVRWVEKRIAEGLPVADYMEGRPRLRLTETDPWLRQRGHLAAERPQAPRPGTKAGA